MAAAICGEGVQCTIGNDSQVATAINAMGAEHIECPVDKAIIDVDNKLVTTPAYMLAACVQDAYKGISKCVKDVLSLV
jgi:enhancing lycopene biosynthesis protein 2